MRHHLSLEITNVIKVLEQIGENLVNWFLNNKMKLNTDKCHTLLNSQEPNTLKVGDLHITWLSKGKTARHNFDCMLKFNKHIEDFCEKALQKLNTLARFAPYMGTTKKMFLWMRFSSPNLVIAY